MYGTIAKTRIKPENRAKMKEVMERQLGSPPKGFVAGYMLFENDSDTGWLVAVFEDRGTYDQNADSPEQHQQYLEYSALLEGEPEWHDGEIQGM